MSKVEDFFLWLSVTDPDVIKRPEVLKREKNIQSTKGIIILVVSSFAWLSGTNVAYVVSKDFSLSILIGLLWGFFIMCVDRLLSAPYKKWRYADGMAKLKNNFLKPFFMRLPLSILLGILISIPINLKIFEPEIRKYWIENNRTPIQSEDSSRIKNLNDEKNSYRNRQTELQNQIDVLNNMLLTSQVTQTTTRGKHDSTFSVSRNHEVTPICWTGKGDKLRSDLKLYPDASKHYL